MARTLEDIEKEITAKAASYQELNDLESESSKVLFWRYIKKTIAFIVQLTEKIIDKHKKEIDRRLSDQEVGTSAWLADKIRKFQFGSEQKLVIRDSEITYETLDESKQIIKQVAIVEEVEGLTVKAVKVENGDYIELNMDEKNALKDYLDNIKFAGIKIKVESNGADLVSLRVKVELTPQIYTPEGKLITDDSKEPVKEALISAFKNIPFNGRIYLSSIIDQLQRIEGVVDVAVTDPKIEKDSTMTDWEQIRYVEPGAGHVKLEFEPASSDETKQVSDKKTVITYVRI